MPTTRKRISRNYQDQSIPEWQIEYLKTGRCELDPIFDELPDGQWPEGLSPVPWDIFEFQIAGVAEKVWQKIKNKVNVDDFEWAHRKFDLGQIRSWAPDGYKWI